MWYTIENRNRIFVKGYGLLSFEKDMSKNIGKNIGKNASNNCNQKLLDYAKQSATDALKTASKRLIQKTADITGDWIVFKIADKITQSASETVSSKRYRIWYWKIDTNTKKKDRYSYKKEIRIILYRKAMEYQKMKLAQQ